MTILLLGAVAVFGARWMVERSTRGFRASLWVLAMGLLVTGQIWVQRDRLASYQLRLLGQRFDVAASDDTPVRARAVSGDRDGADIYVPGIGTDPVAVLEVGGAGDGGRSVAVAAAGGTLGVVAVRTQRGWRRGRWSLLRSVALESGDRIRVRRGGAEAVMTYVRTGAVDEVVVRWPEGGDALAGGDVRVTVPYPEGAGVLGLFRRRPSVFQRTYPLADLMGAGGRDAGLRSFLYYARGAARVVLLDDGVAVLSGGGAEKESVRTLPVWSGAGPAPLFSVAGLPYRDFPEPKLAAVERYGIRPLRSFRARVDEGWLTVRGPRPEIHAVELAGLPAGRRIERTADGDDLNPLRLSAGDAAGTRADLTLSSPANGFAAAAQAVLRLPDVSTAGWFELLAPSGLARWDTGRPFTLSDGDKGLLLRVDGLGVSAGFILLLVVLFVLAAVPFALLETSGAVRAVALATLGLAALRLLVSLSAKARFPFVDEGHQISLWLIPAVPWIVCVAGWVLGGGAEQSSRTVSPTGVALTPRGFSGGFMGAVPDHRGPGKSRWLARILGSAQLPPVAAVVLGATLIFLVFTLFPDSRAKAAALSAVVVVLAGLALGAVPRAGSSFLGWLRARRPVRWIGDRLLRGVPPRWTGVALGFALFAIRFVLDIAGFREQLSLGGTRIGLSVLYTPAALICFALLAAAHDRRVSSSRPGMIPAAVAIAWLDLSGFLLFAYAATSFWISDFGIAFTTLPGPLLVLAWVGLRWSRRTGPGAAFLGALPIFLFAVLQMAPDLARPTLAGEVEVASRLDDWSRNELLLLERGDPEALKLIGESRSEALGVMRETMRSYTRGNWSGRGFLAGRVSPQIRTTATREHVVTGLLASQWGLLGALGLLAMLIGVLVPVVSPGGPRRPRWARGRRKSALTAGLAVAAGLAFASVVLPSPTNVLVLGTCMIAGMAAALVPALLSDGRSKPDARVWPGALGDRLWLGGASAREDDSAPENPPAPPLNPFHLLSATALVSFAAAGVYMILANYGLVLFTGKNVYLLGLDSLGDTLEALALIGIGVGALGLAEGSAAGARADGSTAGRPEDGPAPGRDLVPSAGASAVAKHQLPPHNTTPRTSRRVG